MSLWKLDKAQIMKRSNSTLMQDGVCAPEACWKIFAFPMYRMYPAIFRLQIHFSDRQQVRFRSHELIANVLELKRQCSIFLYEYD